MEPPGIMQVAACMVVQITILYGNGGSKRVKSLAEPEASRAYF